MNRYLSCALMATLLCAGATVVKGQPGSPATFPMAQGEMAATLFSGPFDPGNPNITLNTLGYVVSVVDVRVPPIGANPVPVPGTNWLAPMFHNEFAPSTPQDIWNAENLGQVFGIALDKSTPPNIYVTATTAFGDFTGAAFAFPNGGFGPGGFGGVYKLDGNTGDIMQLTSTVPNGSGGVGTTDMPNSGPALGNICFDPDFDQLFVTNMEDGKIYRMDTAGMILSVFDPFQADIGTPDFARRGERLWAVQKYKDRLYFSVWLRDGATPTSPWNAAAGPAPANPNNSIWSVAINSGTGDFSGSESLELVMPYLGSTVTYSNPVSDIAFSQDGEMLTAERTMPGDFGQIDTSHASRVLEFKMFAGNWVSTGNEYQVGVTYNYTAGMYANTAGGIDYECDQDVWASGDTLDTGLGTLYYGWQGIPAGGNTTATPISTSYIVDEDGDGNGPGKATIADLEVYDICTTTTSECFLSDDGTRCNGECTDGTSNCHASEIITDAGGNFIEISCCACDPDPCHLVLDPSTLSFQCTQGCPDPGAQQCRKVGQGRADGTISWTCQCLDPMEPTQCEEFGPVESPGCRKQVTDQCFGICPDPEDACVPVSLTRASINLPDFYVSECDCVSIGEQCHPVLMDEHVSCEPACPDGRECEVVLESSPSGQGTKYSCDPCGSTDPPIGACCYEGADGSSVCIETTQFDCQITLSGYYYGDGTTCAIHGQDCDPLAEEGACCYEDQEGTSICVITSQVNCVNNLHGNYQGDSTNCVPDPCDDPATGACCWEDINHNVLCTEATQVYCEETLLGIYYGDNVDCDESQCDVDEECDCLGDCDDATPAYGDPAYAPFTDEVAVATMYADLASDYVLVNVDIKNRNTAPLNVNWAAAALYSHPSWTRANLGTIFGLALDSQGNTYVTTTTTYYTDYTGIGGNWGDILKINANTGAISVFATLPNTGPALGNICYDAANDQLFVTNHEDGRIYRLDMSGTILSTFDHATDTITLGGAPESGDPAGYVPLGERIWGVQVYDGRVYYGVWLEDQGRPSAGFNNSIRSVALNGSGDFVGVSQPEITLPTFSFWQGWSNPPSDIAFSENGCMLVSERCMSSDTYPGAHQARVLEYRQNLTGTWVPSGSTFGIGVIGSGNNASGGVDFDREGNIWATADAIQFSPLTVYGLQSLPCEGGDVTDSVIRDLNEYFSTADKTDIGDVEVACPEKCVAPPKGMYAWYPLDETSGSVADDIAWYHDGQYVGTAPVAGMVQGARTFNGAGDYVRVNNAAALNFGTGDFSIDAWVRLTSSGLRVITEKRQNGPTRGYSFFVYNGNIGCQLADAGSGVGYTNWVASTLPPVNDGTWHHVALTVDRDLTTGLRLYVDGVFQAFNPTGRSGSLNNPSNLYIGQRDPSFGPRYYRGEIDEVEIFRRVVPQMEIQDIYSARSSGKCKDRCILPRRRSICINKNTITINLTICNDGPVDHDYFYIMYGDSSCSGPAPASISPSIGIVTVPAGSCVNVPITITKPPGLFPGLESCFRSFIYNLDTGHFFGCQGSIRAIWRWCGIIVIGDPIDILWHKHKRATFEVINQGDDAATLNYELRVANPDGTAPMPPIVSLDGLPPGQPVANTVQLPPGEAANISVDLSVESFEPFTDYQLQLWADDDGDGSLEMITAVGVQGQLPCGDFNGDSVIDAVDYGLWRSCFGGPDGAAPAGCPADVVIDCDGDGDNDMRDFRAFQEAFGLSVAAP